YYFLLNTFCATHTNTDYRFSFNVKSCQAFQVFPQKSTPVCKTVPYVVQKKRTLRLLPKCSWVVVV
ncbi:MAG: hypothetical protein IJF10_05015, partial [Clostridia bacterium]|nr:hypothetical protein [Clostridia bacterium]